MYIRKLICIYLILFAILLTSCENDFLPESDLNKAPLNDTVSISEGAIEINEIYKERITQRSGSITMNKKGLKFDLTYDSVFYGHDSAINRDLISYCRRFDDNTNVNMRYVKINFT